VAEASEPQLKQGFWKILFFSTHPSAIEGTFEGIQYFRDIDKRSIAEEFFIDHRAFLLKPPKSPNIYYI